MFGLLSKLSAFWKLVNRGPRDSNCTTTETSTPDRRSFLIQGGRQIFDGRASLSNTYSLSFHCIQLKRIPHGVEDDLHSGVE
jgi:hypothetical protein